MKDLEKNEIKTLDKHDNYNTYFKDNPNINIFNKVLDWRKLLPIDKQINQSIDLFFEHENIPKQLKLFFKDKVIWDNYFNVYSVPFKELEPVKSGYIDKDGNHNMMESDSDDIYNYDKIAKELIDMASRINEDFLRDVYNPKIYELKSEPNGLNECPDYSVKNLLTRMTSYIEMKAVFTKIKPDKNISAVINNAMKDIKLVLFEVINGEPKKPNKCGISMKDITMVYLFYVIDPVNRRIYFIKHVIIPAMLVISVLFNKDGSFKKLGQKSNNNFNTTTSLTLPVPYNNHYNSLFDRYCLIKYGHTLDDRTGLTSNTEALYIDYKKQFNLYMAEFNNKIQKYSDTYNKAYCEDFLTQLKLYKYNTNPYATEIDKQYVKDSIKAVKAYIKTL